jgi:hypothetical protein
VHILSPSKYLTIRTRNYHDHESFHSLAGLESSKGLHMIDLEVDDDEWQLTAWFLKDQDKETPMSTLDYQQNLFAVTGAFRGQVTEDDGYVVFSRDHFDDMFGPFPKTFNKDTDMDQLVVCPYTYDVANMEFTNTIAGGHPLLFHFAGNDWLCACSIFESQSFQNVPHKFYDNCKERYPSWFDRIEEGILNVASSVDKDFELYLEVDDDAVQDGRRLDSLEGRALDSNPYKMINLSNPYLRNRNPYGLMMKSFSKPYDSNIIKPLEGDFPKSKSKSTGKSKSKSKSKSMSKGKSKPKSKSQSGKRLLTRTELDDTNLYPENGGTKRRRMKRQGPRGLKEGEMW